jgi:hypothetical protein
MDLRLATYNDAPLCNSLYNETYNKSRTVNQWEWEFVRPNCPDLIPYVLAFEGGELVGTQAYIPIPFIDEEGVFLTAKSEETLVSPQMRGKSVFPIMYERLFALASSQNMKSIWGFTPATKAFTRLGFSTPEQAKLLVLSNSWRGLPSLTGGRPGWRGVARHFGLAVASVFLAVWGRVRGGSSGGTLRSPETLVTLENASPFSRAYSEQFIATWGGTTILRDASYMQWRIFDNPYLKSTVVGAFADGQLLGHVAFVVDGEAVGHVIDIMAAHPGGRNEDERLTKILLAEAVKRLRSEGATIVRAFKINGHPYDALVAALSHQLGFIRLDRGSAVVFHTDYQSEKRGSSHDDFSNWFVTLLFTEGQLG